MKKTNFHLIIDSNPNPLTTIYVVRLGCRNDRESDFHELSQIARDRGFYFAEGGVADVDFINKLAVFHGVKTFKGISLENALAMVRDGVVPTYFYFQHKSEWMDKCHFHEYLKLKYYGDYFRR